LEESESIDDLIKTKPTITKSSTPIVTLGGKQNKIEATQVNLNIIIMEE